MTAVLNPKSPKFIGRNSSFSLGADTAFAVKSDRNLYRMNYSCPEPKLIHHNQEFVPVNLETFPLICERSDRGNAGIVNERFVNGNT